MIIKIKIHDRTMELLDKAASDNDRTADEFIEKAIIFFIRVGQLSLESQKTIWNLMADDDN